MDERFAIGLDLGGTDLKAGLVTSAGEVRDFLRRPSRTQESAEAPLEVVVEAVRELRRRARDERIAIGIGCPGVIEPGTGVLIGHTPHMPYWNTIPLGERLA